MISHGKDIKIFTGNANPKLAADICKIIGTKLGESEVKSFADGEASVSLYETVRGSDVFLVQSTCKPVNDNLMELLILVDALRRASANTINVVLPYYGYARQDRKARSREPITAKLVANMLQNSGVDRVVALDLHAAQIQGFFDIPVDHLMGAPLLADYFIREGVADKTVVVSPDHGGVTRARALAEFLKAPIAIIDKRRPKANVAQIMNIIGNVKGKKCIMIDDMIDTAGTISKGSQALIDAGAEEVYASCTHAVLSGPAIERLANSPLKEVVVTDTIRLPEEKQITKIKQVSVAPLIADAIKRINENRAVSPLFNNRFRQENIEK